MEKVKSQNPCVKCQSKSCRIDKKICTSRKRYNRFCRKHGIDYKVEDILLDIKKPWKV